MMISLILLKRYWQNETNDSKKNHQQWPEWATRAVQRQVSLDTSGQLVWPTLFTVLWSFLVLLSSSHQDFSNNTGDIIIKASVYLKDYFFFLCFFSLLLVICEEREKKNTPLVWPVLIIVDIFFCIVELVLSRSFKWYWLCHH
jgi:cell division protein FtsW (lipid II flippase)